VNALVSACDKRALQAPMKPARAAPIARWLALGVNVAGKYQRVLDGVHMDQPGEYNAHKVRTRTLPSSAAAIGAELMRGVLMATGGLSAMAILVMLASFRC
jgi:hypothetical protein